MNENKITSMCKSIDSNHGEATELNKYQLTRRKQSYLLTHKSIKETNS